MSIPVKLEDLPQVLERYGFHPYLLSVSAESTPRATSVSVQWEGSAILAGVGRRTVANLNTNAAVALLWPPPTPGDYTLIVDGRGTVEGMGRNMAVRIEPTSAILHVTQVT
ncbi:MAG TPA: hypothetical protein VFW71_00130 [Actinomycetota bacterium]|nr:hypothetical protein [Actinomycetota bacterium]